MQLLIFMGLVNIWYLKLGYQTSPNQPNTTQPNAIEKAIHSYKSSKKKPANAKTVSARGKKKGMHPPVIKALSEPSQ